MLPKKIFMSVLALTGALAVSMNAYAAAGGPGEIVIPKENRAYPDDYYTGGWKWIDMDKDGMAECYAFGPYGYAYIDTTTPDGYTVNKFGQWTVDGVVQTQPVANSAADTTTTTVAAASNDLSSVNTITTADYDYWSNWLTQDHSSEIVWDNGGYDEQGVSNSLLYMYTHSQEENKKFGELFVFTGVGGTTIVYYKNGFRVDYVVEGCGRIKGAYQDDFFTPNPDYSYSFKYWKNTSAREIGDRLLAEGVFTSDQLSYRNAGDTNLYIHLADGSILSCSEVMCGF